MDAAMTVETSELICAIVALSECSRSVAMRLSAVLSSTTTASALSVSRLSVSSELYGCTTTSPPSWLLGKTEYVWISFFGKWSLIASSIREPMPEPVPPAIECVMMKPSRLSEPSASRSIMSMISSCTCPPMSYPLAQLLPAPPPSGCW